ncbi:hypothetical protein [Aliivibrio sp. SR45-2]|uniref:hypothetical protein n=1 Tax=Aliivibrio sp. SR45-2 TaxID=2760931 RepID=UPI001C727F16|nr:hypothetical protein [Aliivibrio sp. SR45-2]
MSKEKEKEKEIKTLIASTYQSFVDMCINDMVKGYKIHCTFPLMTYEIDSLERLFYESGGLEMTVSKIHKK